MYSAIQLLNNRGQDGREKRTAKRLCVTNVTGLLPACFVVIFTYINVFWSFTKKICLKEGKIWRKVFSNKITVTLVTKGCRLLSSPVLLRKLTINRMNSSDTASLIYGTQTQRPKD